MVFFFLGGWGVGWLVGWLVVWLVNWVVSQPVKFYYLYLASFRVTIRGCVYLSVNMPLLQLYDCPFT
jgi:hypothetical protein